MVQSNGILYKENEHPDHVVVIKYVPYVGKFFIWTKGSYVRVLIQSVLAHPKAIVSAQWTSIPAKL